MMHVEMWRTPNGRQLITASFMHVQFLIWGSWNSGFATSSSCSSGARIPDADDATALVVSSTEAAHLGSCIPQLRGILIYLFMFNLIMNAMQEFWISQSGWG